MVAKILISRSISFTKYSGRHQTLVIELEEGLHIVSQVENGEPVLDVGEESMLDELELFNIIKDFLDVSTLSKH